MAPRKTYAFLKQKPANQRRRGSTPPTVPRETGGDRFARRYNRTLGRSSGRVLEPPDRSPAGQQRRITQTRQGRPARSRSVSLGTSKLPARVQRQHETWLGGGSGLTPQTQIEDNLGKIYDELAADFRERQQEQTAISNEYFTQHPERLPEPPEVGGWSGVFKDVMDVASAVPGVPSAETFAGSPMGRAFDVASRASYGGWEGIRNAVEGMGEAPDESDKSILSGLPDILKGPLTDAGSSFLAGASQGLMGKRKTGPGDVYEAVKQNPNWAGGETLRQFEKDQPQIEQRVAQAIGVAGEITDPFPNVGFGQTGVFSKNANEIGAAGRVTQDSQRAATVATATKAVDEYYDNVYSPRSGNQRYVIDRDTFVQAATVNALDRLAVSEVNIRGGGARGSRYKVMNPRLWSHTVAQSVQESVRNTVLKRFNYNHNMFWRRIHEGNPLSDKAVENMIALDPDFAQYMDNLDTQLSIGTNPKIAPNSPLPVLLAELSNKTHKFGESAKQAIVDAYDADLQKVGQDVYSMTRNASYRTLGLRVGKTIIPVKVTGRAYNAVAQRLQFGAAGDLGGAGPKFSNISYESMFPSVLSLRAQRARSVGSAAFKQFKKDIQAIAKKYSPEQARELHDAIENNVDLSGDAHMQAGKEALMKAYADMWKNEIAAGVRSPDDVLAPNYVFIYNRKGKVGEDGARTVFKRERKAAIKAGLPNHGNRNMAEAKRLGLKPVDNAFEAVMHRYLKSQRDITRSLYRTDLIENYGFRTQKIGDIARGNRNLAKIDYDKLPQHLRSEIDYHGGEYYLPKAHMETSTNFDKLSSWNSAEMGPVIREWNKFMNIWKFWQTIPAPGFHVTNFVGDTYMGMMDGVKAWDYTTLMRKVAASKAGQPAMYKIAPGFELSVAALWTMYQKDAAGGYYHIDIGNYVKPSTKNVVGRLGRGTRDIAVDLSEMREDFGRFAHYIHAFKDEAKKAYKKGETSNFKLMNAARDSALWRVNHYRFDYSALTLWERKAKTIGIPFYTFARKVVPILLESMYQNPKYITAINRFMIQNDGSAADAFSNWDAPEYLRMGGGAYLNENEEPLFGSLSALPLGNVNTLQPGGTWDPRDPRFLFGLGSLASKYTGPPIQMPFEAATKREIFSGQEIDPTSWDYFLNKIPMVEDIRSEGNQIPGLNRIIPGADQPFDPQSMLFNRSFGAGQQIRPVTYGQQAQAHKQWEDELIEDPMSEINSAQNLYTVSKSNRPSPEGRMTFRVLSRLESDKNGEPGLIQEFSTAKEAIDFVRSILPPGYRNSQQYMTNQLDPLTGLPGQVTRPR